MAKPPPAEEDSAALRRRLRRSLAAVAAGGATGDVFDEAASALEALREAELGTGGRKGCGGEGRRPAVVEEGEKEVVTVPPHFLCPISSRIMSDPVIVASGQVRNQQRFFYWFWFNKKVIGDDPEAIPFLIWALKSGDMGSRGNSAAAIFTLSALDSNKEKIGELGAMGPLVDLLADGNIIAKKDAASAIFNLCLLHENKSRATKNGIVDVAMRAIDDQLLVDGSLAILALLSSNHEVVEMITKFDGTACMLRAIRESECSRSKENAVVVLFAICMFNRLKLKEVEADEKINSSLALLAQTGTSRARRKAVGILEKMKRSMHNRHMSC
nr:unnamed protein product [Digitaria exilis]